MNFHEILSIFVKSYKITHSYTICKILWFLVKSYEFSWNHMNFRKILPKLTINILFMKFYLFSWNPIYFREILQITIIAIFVKSHLISWNLIVFREVLTIFVKSSNNPFPTVRFRKPRNSKKKSFNFQIQSYIQQDTL